MDILFTGASSFTGMWFVKELIAAGHRVTAIFKRPQQEYSGVRLERIQMLIPHCQCFFDVKFGDDKFIEIIQSQKHWDVLCHHAADVTDYKSPHFNAVRALENNTHNIVRVLEALRKQNCNKMLLTGSVFEQNEGIGSMPLAAFSPYGLSKGLTYDLCSYYCGVHGIILSKFVIPNPFGPYEEPRFTSYLMDTWMDGKVAEVKTPLYIRDNIHVTLLAKGYSHFVQVVHEFEESRKFHPSCYAETQGDFSQRLAAEMRSRLHLSCELHVHTQTSFSEPLERLNYNSLDWRALGWNEAEAWDEYASYYASRKAHKIGCT